MKESPTDIELLIRHTSRTGTLPAVSLTNRAENEKMRLAKNEQVRPESQMSLHTNKPSSVLHNSR